MIVVDASVLIAHLDAHDAQHERVLEALLATADEALGCSPVTRAEVLVGPARRGRLDVAEDALTAIGLADIPLPGDAGRRLAQLQADSGLRLPDCCVLLAAQDAPATELLTFDQRLARVAARLGYGGAKRD